MGREKERKEREWEREHVCAWSCVCFVCSQMHCVCVSVCFLALCSHWTKKETRFRIQHCLVTAFGRAFERKCFELALIAWGSVPLCIPTTIHERDSPMLQNSTFSRTDTDKYIQKYLQVIKIRTVGQWSDARILKSEKVCHKARVPAKV